MLFHTTIILFLSTGWGDITTGTKKMCSECSHFEEWVPVLLYRLVCCSVEMQRDVNCMSCLPVCRHCGYHLFSSVSKNHLILLKPAVLEIGWAQRGSTGLMWFWRQGMFSVALIALVFLVNQWLQCNVVLVGFRLVSLCKLVKFVIFQKNYILHYKFKPLSINLRTYPLS